jgi:16S rRNA (uracil1498-N3)-methyltransferase
MPNYNCYNLRRIFIPEENWLVDNNQLKITDENIFHRIKNVLRLRLADSFRIFNSTHGEHVVKIINYSKNFLEIELVEVVKPRGGSLSKVNLIIGLIKQEKLRYIIEKATEIGVNQFIFFNADHSVKENIKHEKVLQQIISAVEQSERLEIPKFSYYQNMSQALNNFSGEIIVCNEKEKSQKITDLQLDQNKNYGLVIGPEGGFSAKEQDLISKYKSVYLSASILKSETAALYSIIAMEILMSGNFAKI